MAAIHDLLAQVQDQALRVRIEKEFDKLSKTKKFGLVFEEHMPECTALYDIPVKKGATVAKKTGAVSEMYEVVDIKDNTAVCYQRVTAEKEMIPIEELVSVAAFGDPVYPYLNPIDSICNAPNSDLWHTIIEADNYHALQLLEYLYAEKVDCIYIDPPYNTGARDWKYNNDYVDSNDSYRHSKWLSFMEKRLRIAKRLLNPNDSVLIITIDEKEYLHLGCMLEELFPEARIQMISSCINPNGAARNKLFTRVDEYIFFVMFGESSPVLTARNMLDKEVQSTESVTWFSLIRTGSNSLRARSENCFYPVFVNNDTGKIEFVGEPLGKGVNRNTVTAREGCTMLWPMHGNGDEGVWQMSVEELKKRIAIGAIRVSRKKGSFVLTYLRQGQLKEIEDGKVKVVGYDDSGAMILKRVEDQLVQARTMWNQPSHDATTFGSKLIKQILPDNTFKYPKSLYAVQDAINFFVANKPNALIVDFFAGSGTTLHAVNLINATDNGKRRCIMITNNELSGEEAKELTAKGYKPGDKEWSDIGIARHVTWPRTVCSIKGHDANGNPLRGNYINDRAMADGFESNVAFYKLDFLDKTSVALGRQLKELFPLLWLKAGSYGQCPQLDDDTCPMLILPDNRFAILMNERYYLDFEEKISEQSGIKTLYYVTDSDAGYREMIRSHQEQETYQLYRDYLDNFRINVRR